MRLRAIGVLLTGLVLASAAPVLAQVTTTGTLRLIIEDPQGGRLPGVSIAASAPDAVTTRQAVSDAEGAATLEALAPSADYIVTASLSGFRDLRRESILVSSGQTTTLRVQLELSTVSEQVTVLARTTPVIDLTRSVSGQDITLRLTEALPTGRNYQSYLQLVPGVLPDSSTSPGNPSSRSGMNWREHAVSENIGVSTDNHYYFEGINVTDPVTGTFGAHLNTEIIQEQKVITGGIPAEYVGSAGLISTVITKSGSNSYSGSYNYFFQNDGFIAENKHNPASTFSDRDTAFTLGGPLVRNHAWVFGSFRHTRHSEELSAQDTHAHLRSPKVTQKQGFLKGTLAPTGSDMLSVTFINDPFERSNSLDPTVANSRDRIRKQGGNNFSGTYNRVWSSLLIHVGVNTHNFEVSDLSIDRVSPRNTVTFQRSAVRALADEQLGGFGQDAPETRPTLQARGSAQYRVGAHLVKAGLEFARHEDHRNLNFIPSGDPSQYTSISSLYGGAGVTAASIANAALWTGRQFNVGNPSDFGGFINRINALPNKAAFYALYDTNADGAISAAELGQSLIFSSTAGNPNGQVNYYRTIQTAEGPQDTEVRGLSFFGQDEFSLARWTFNIGLRGERWTHYATTGKSVHAFDWTLAPRLSAVLDIAGDGTKKISAYWGRYYDPIRVDITNYAGTLTGQVREEQVFANNQWVTYRTRGGAVTQNGFFSETAKTPYTDELQLQYEEDLGGGMSAGATYYRRQTRDIFEDFDPTVYTVPSAYGDVNAPNSLFLGWDYFGWTAADHPVANFYLGTLKGGERNYNGLELALRKRFSDRWQALFSYNYLDGKGNAMSDGNNDSAGDLLWLDPRAPDIYGTIPGTIHHVFKTAGSYTTGYGLELGGTYRWNSGTIANQTQLDAGYRIPVQVAPSAAYLYGGVVEQWIQPGAVGAVHNPGWGAFDARVRYVRAIQHVRAEVFVDVFNLFNDQAPTQTEDLVAGTGTTTFGSAIQWVSPRRAMLGVRVGF